MVKGVTVMTAPGLQYITQPALVNIERGTSNPSESSIRCRDSARPLSPRNATQPRPLYRLIPPIICRDCPLGRLVTTYVKPSMGAVMMVETLTSTGVPGVVEPRPG